MTRARRDRPRTRRGSRFTSHRPASALDALTIVIDAGEQLPYVFPPADAATARYAIPVGDYSIAGLEDRFAIERKSLEDLFNTVIGDRARFVEELERARGYAFFAVLVEATFREVVEYTSPRSTRISEAQRAARPATVINSLNAWAVEYGLRVYYVDRDRDLCRALVLRLAERFYERARDADAAARDPLAILDGLTPGAGAP